MVKKRSNLKVIKVPLGYKQQYKPINFPPMPQLYLDLLENKQKVKEELREVLYEPRWDSNESTNWTVSTEEINNASQDFRNSLKEFDEDGGIDLTNLKLTAAYNSDIKKSSVPFSTISFSSTEQQHIPSIISNDNNDPYMSISATSFDKPYSIASKQEGSPHNINAFPIARADRMKYSQSNNSAMFADDSSNNVMFSNEPYEDIPQQQQYQPQQSQYQPDDYNEPTVSFRNLNIDGGGNSSQRPRIQYPDTEDEEEDEIGRFLSSDIPDKKPTQSVYTNEGVNVPKTSKNSNNNNSGGSNIPQFQHPPNNRAASFSNNNRPAGLDAINQGYSNNSSRPKVLNVNSVSKSDEEKAQRRSWLRFQFNKLRKLYKEAKIPEFGEYADVDEMEREYQSLCQQLHIESNVETYKQWLTCGFGVVEFIVSRFLKFQEISGFAAQQMISMNKYEKILYEIGEKHKPNPDKKGLPPEIKLCGIVLFNAAVFCGMKMLMKGAGNSIMNEISPPSSSSSFGAGGHSTNTNIPNPNSMNSSSSRKPMKGPDIDFDDI